jgi:hypothetical protein
VHGSRWSRRVHGSRWSRRVHGTRWSRRVHGSRWSRRVHGSRWSRRVHGSRWSRRVHGSRWSRRVHGDRPSGHRSDRPRDDRGKRSSTSDGVERQLFIPLAMVEPISDAMTSNPTVRRPPAKWCGRPAVSDDQRCQTTGMSDGQRCQTTGGETASGETASGVVVGLSGRQRTRGVGARCRARSRVPGAPGRCCADDGSLARGSSPRRRPAGPTIPFREQSLRVRASRRRHRWCSADTDRRSKPRVPDGGAVTQGQTRW